jgi:TonB family protein
LIELNRKSLTENPENSSADPHAWKRLIGEKPVDARLDTLPENKVRWSALVVSSTVQLALATAVAALPLFFPQTLSTRMIYQVTPLAAPVTEIPLPVERPIMQATARPIPAEPVEPVHVAKLFNPRALVAPKPKIVERPNQEVPKFEPTLMATKFATPEPERPREPVKTGVLNTGSSAQPTLNAAVEKVQTGGFGDAHGLAGDAADTKHGNVARVGSFELPPGPGYGNGTGGANGARGAVASAGFGNGVATPAASSTHGTVQSGGFASAAVATEAKAAPRHVDNAPATQAVVILGKPNPVYTDEARKLGIEGEVLVEVIFKASGQVQTVRVVKGLGHGLDEAALRAAEQIRFKPALQEGHTVDFPAVAHIVFQLAF